MAVTEKQAFVLENLERIVVRRAAGRSRYSLDDNNCRTQIASLAVQGLVKWDGKAAPSRIAEPKSPDVGPRGERVAALDPVPGGAESALAPTAR